MSIDKYTRPTLLHKTEHETAVLAREWTADEHVKLLRLVPFNEEAFLNAKLLAELEQQDGIRTYQTVSTLAAGKLIRTMEEFLEEIPLCERIVQYILQEEHVPTKEIEQLTCEIVNALDRGVEQISKLVTDESKLPRILLSSLTLHNVTILPSDDGSCSAVRCILKGLGLAPVLAEDSAASIATQFGRLLYCLLATSVQDTLPIKTMITSLQSCTREADLRWHALASLAIECLSKPTLQLTEIQRLLYANNFISDSPVAELPPELPSFALSPPLSPQRSPSPLPLSLSELLLDRQQHYTPLMIAIISNQLHTARIVYKDFLHKRDAHRNTALMLAVLCNNVPLVELLVEHEHSCTNADGDTALLIAITNGYYECCLPLFSHEILVPNSITGFLPRRTAFDACQHAILDAIIAFQNIPRDSGGCTTLMRAVIDKASIDDLVDEQFGCTHDGSNGYTALMFAIVNGNDDACRKLAKYEALINDSTGKSPLEIAILSHQKACALTLLQNSQNPVLDVHINTDLLNAITTEQWKVAEKLFKQSVGARSLPRNAANQSRQKNFIQNIIKVDTAGNTELMSCLATGSSSDIEHKKDHWQALIPTHAGHINKAGETALYIAIERGITSAIPLLVPYEMHIRDNYGRLPLRQAVDLRSARAVTAILDTLHLLQDLNQRLHITKLLDYGSWSVLTRFLEDSPDTSALL